MQKKSFIITALIGIGYLLGLTGIANHLGYNMDPVVLGWVSGVLAMGMAVMCDDYIARTTTVGGK